jgi:hypothetical protein
MREELKSPKVEGISIAVVRTSADESNEKEFYVYLMNLRDDIIEGIIVTSTGYGEDPVTGEKIKTSTLRHCIELLLPNEAAKIEPIMPELFTLANEYWVSFWVNDVLYDKKFVFVGGTIEESKFQFIEQLQAKGVVLS